VAAAQGLDVLVKYFLDQGDAVDSKNSVSVGIVVGTVAVVLLGRCCVYIHPVSSTTLLRFIYLRVQGESGHQSVQ